MRRGLLLLPVVMAVLHSPGPSPAPAAPVPAGLPLLLGFTNAPAWRVESQDPDRTTLVSPILESPAPWNELVVSWNVHPAGGAGLRVEAQAILADRETRYYPLGIWSLGEPAPWPRTSDPNPVGADAGAGADADPDGSVKTDTLQLRTPARAVRLRLALADELSRHPERLRLVTVSLADTRVRAASRPANPRVWGTTLDVPERSQVAHPEGQAWCSPTCVSMLLGWWARSLDQPGLDRDVPEVARGVHDPAWPGTGNWPFNTAYAASAGGMTACAARLHDLRAVEDLIAAGIPVALSVNAPALRGESGKENGHLILAVGFTPDGDVVANDPFARLDQGQRVRRTYRRNHVERAWDNSHRLAYLIAPTARHDALPVIWR